LAQPAALKLLDGQFKGEWRYLRQTVHEFAEIRADRALLEMATQLRVLDDAQGLNDYFKQTGQEPLGTVTQGDGTTTDLHFRDMTNKVMHAARFEWNLASEPKVVCHPHDGGRWQRAEIRILPLMALVGQLMT
jgi:hypothetical protein